MTALAVSLVIGAGIVVRLWLMTMTGVVDWLAGRNELVTPLTSWKRVTEGVVLHRAGLSPYSGDVFHEMPLVLRAFARFDAILGPSIHLLFIVADVCLAVVLGSVGRRMGTYLLRRQADEWRGYDCRSSKLLVKAESLALNQLYIVGAYMLNPLAIASCVAKSTAVFGNLAIALAILYTMKGSRIGASVFIALAAYLSLYPIVLVVPAALFLTHIDVKSHDLRSYLAATSLVQTGVCTFSALGLLLYASQYFEGGSWDFLQSTYGFILNVPDLTPNIGVFWYFFTEMFEHFRLFFICVFQIHAFIYVVPLTFRLADHPIFLTYMLVALGAIFKSYPSYADCVLYLSLLPLWRHVMRYMRNNFVVAVMFAVCAVLAPVLWHLWLLAGSANANFYFAITLVLCTAQIFLLTDLLFAFLRREYDLVHGPDPPIVDGKPAQVILE